MSSPPLTPAQTHALFDILIHHQLYGEIEAFKYPDAIDHYGYPFKKEDGTQTTSPLLQNMFNKFALRLPGLSDIGRDFWQVKCRVLLRKMAEAELSESYDKGAIGARKALATAISSVLEYISRGILGGFPGAGTKEGAKEKEYDISKADDILQAWDDGVREIIYGDLLDDMFENTAATGKLEDHTSLVKAMHEYILLNLASFMHHIFIMSPDGQYMIRLIENVHRLVPYYLVKQTLRVGNAATMINGMVKLVLTKVSVTAVTNWIGLTNNSNDGMNLMQQILSTVMSWDTAEFQKKALKLESIRDAPDKKVYKAIKQYVYESRDIHDAARDMSRQESKSIIGVILETSDLFIDADSLTEHQHEIAIEYYSNLLSIRDREELTKLLCKMQPDLLTPAIRDVVGAFDPVIRGVHTAVDLSGTITDLEAFLTDLIKVSKPKKARPDSRNGEGSQAGSRSSSPAPASIADKNADVSIPTVEDYVQLLRKHIPSCHKFLHQVTKNAPELANQYLDYAKACAAEFQMHDSTPPNEDRKREDGQYAAGNMTGPIHSIFSSFDPKKQEELKRLLDHHSKYLKQLKLTSQSRLKAIMQTSHPKETAAGKAVPQPHTKGTTHGPGMYLSRWHSLLDSTLITPATLHGPVRRGWEVKGELDGKGLKTDTLLVSAQKHQRASSRERGFGIGAVADGTGDVVERRERRRDGLEEERTKEVWATVGREWVGVCKGLEILGED
ncbi:hypothetical protein P154DRAFT_422694 [Amniculicola lignicola CBS 123094]|uniref:PX domain-containing protein n=1 Tax=Amniculicola lignicola CBS 123094 TaxID=1392246 RepID=A0A6A5X0T4_9PLEO|nr:hypothetical protein P154DRAFT_422694 [Amniculicola lignicola CBS 123094]